MSYPQRNRQQGVTLIELMIGLTISMILMIAIVSIYVTSKRGYALQDGMARAQENARFTMDLLLHDIRMAGYPKSAIAEPIIAATTSDGGGAASDTITLQYNSNTDCLGQATGGVAINRYSIDGNGNLVCQGNGGAGTDIIADGIYNMQILYGVDTDTEADTVANKYVSWNNLAAGEINRIVSIRIGVLGRTNTDAGSAMLSKTYDLLGESVTVTDRRIHRSYVNTVVMRNRL